MSFRTHVATVFVQPVLLSASYQEFHRHWVTRSTGSPRYDFNIFQLNSQGLIEKIMLIKFPVHFYHFTSFPYVLPYFARVHPFRITPSHGHPRPPSHPTGRWGIGSHSTRHRHLNRFANGWLESAWNNTNTLRIIKMHQHLWSTSAQKWPKVNMLETNT